MRRENDKVTVFDPLRKKWLVLTPEEQVRQYLLHYLMQVKGYPKTLIAVEKKIKVGSMDKRFDIVVYNRNHEPWMLVECKAPFVVIDQATLFQLLNYQRTIQCDYWVMSNGHQHFCADARNVQAISWLTDLPLYNV
ncbi:type I restriction enzyme HsdR N-terminal domain-containing protein [Taibaiella soli]|uniref:type I restriction enzyme HsdR N-terminal domain-containing protein n=1 Tax=Taibaiella soli TaxID=1649169 RepID=UPI001A9D5387|nr:type I restriction enzyme HsdR N-terminal domain-containing protein [Taibaiella soli]